MKKQVRSACEKEERLSIEQASFEIQVIGQEKI